MVNNMDAVFLRKKALLERVFGKMERESNGLIKTNRIKLIVNQILKVD